ncbi:MAG TPA: isochorismatase family protein [Micromonosporaceae bacterium]|nr:isochorismatase family protein [Micromonosporaceae bacterium]
MTVSLPTIAAYPLPTAADLPAARVTWRPHADRAALLVHDMQHHWTDRFDPATLDEVVDRIARLRKVCTDAGIPVIYTAQPGGQSRAERGLLFDFWGAGLPDDAHAKAIVDRLSPNEGDHVVTKHRYSGFFDSNLASLLGRRDQLIITGVYAHIGVQVSAVDAFMRGIAPFVVADATADFSAEHHHGALRWAADRCARVVTTDQFLAEVAR